MNKVWSLYIVRCAKGAYYTGISNDVSKRIIKHNTGKGAKCMKMLGTPVTLVYSEEVGTYSQALKRERQIKKYTRKKKEELINRSY
jgi:putative endonuclease